MAQVTFQTRCELDCCGCEPEVTLKIRDPGAILADGTSTVKGTLLNYCDSATPIAGIYTYEIFVEDALLIGTILPSDIENIGCYGSSYEWLEEHALAMGGAAVVQQYVDIPVPAEQGYVVLTQAAINAAKGGTLDIGSTVVPSNFIHSKVISTVQWLPTALVGDPASEELGLSQSYVILAGNPLGAVGEVVQVLRGSPDPGSNFFTVRFYFSPIPA